MSRYEYNYRLYIGENKSGNLDAVGLAKDAKILHLRNAVFGLNKASLPNTSRNTLEVYPPGTEPPFPPDGLDPGIVIQKFIGDDENKDIANELRKGTWIVVAPTIDETNAIGAAPAPAPMDQLQELCEKAAGTDVSDRHPEQPPKDDDDVLRTQYFLPGANLWKSYTACARLGPEFLAKKRAASLRQCSVRLPERG